MQKKASSNSKSRLANSSERAFQSWVKEQPCVFCGQSGPGIVDHSEGSTFSNQKILVGHWFVVASCLECDIHKTLGSHRRQFDITGIKHSEACIGLLDRYPGTPPPMEVYEAIKAWRR